MSERGTPGVAGAVFEPMALANEFRSAEVHRGGIELPTRRFTAFSWDDARATARSRDHLRIADGDTMIGYKLGWTSAAMRNALGIDRPNWGTLWESQRLPARFAVDRFRHAKVEPEIVFVAGERLEGDAVTAADVVESARGWAVGLEVVDPRFPTFQFDWLDNTADNSSAAGIRTGPVPKAGLASGVDDPADWQVEFSDGIERRHGAGDAAMGSPAEAVAWLAAALAAEGHAIEPGHLVYTGGLAAPFDLTPGRRYSARCEALGSTAFDIAKGSG